MRDQTENEANTVRIEPQIERDLAVRMLFLIQPCLKLMIPEDPVVFINKLVNLSTLFYSQGSLTCSSIPVTKNAV